GYPVGFLIAPVFIYEGWEEEYQTLLEDLKAMLPEKLAHPVTFEVISHRYTSRAKNRILEIFPETTLDMEDEKRTFKYGQFGYGKFVYPKESLDDIKRFFKDKIEKLFETGEIKYII
ncbi:MAG: spore photoproduct lyase, partial [Clostridia bacterium]|nr:spore photoproduct lyase [Clostridia bacterium]